MSHVLFIISQIKPVSFAAISGKKKADPTRSLTDEPHHIENTLLKHCTTSHDLGAVHGTKALDLG